MDMAHKDGYIKQNEEGEAQQIFQSYVSSGQTPTDCPQPKPLLYDNNNNSDVNYSFNSMYNLNQPFQQTSEQNPLFQGPPFQSTISSNPSVTHPAIGGPEVELPSASLQSDQTTFDPTQNLLFKLSPQGEVIHSQNQTDNNALPLEAGLMSLPEMEAMRMDPLYYVKNSNAMQWNLYDSRIQHDNNYGDNNLPLPANSTALLAPDTTPQIANSMVPRTSIAMQSNQSYQSPTPSESGIILGHSSLQPQATTSQTMPLNNATPPPAIPFNMNSGPRQSRATYRHSDVRSRRAPVEAGHSETTSTPSYPPRAIAPTLNYIFGLDGLMQAQQRLRPKGKLSGGNQIEKTSTPNDEKSSFLQTLGSRQKLHSSESLQQPQIQSKASYQAQQADNDLQRILVNLPPIFPLGPPPSSPNNNHATTTNLGLRQQLPVSVNSDRSSDWRSQETIQSQQLQTTMGRFNPQFRSQTAAATIGRHHHMHGATSPPEVNRDALLWKLFVPQPPISKGSCVAPPTSPRGNKAANALASTASNLTEASVAAEVQDEDATAPLFSTSRLLIVVRRLPDKIIPVLNRPSVVSHLDDTGGTTDESSTTLIWDNKIRLDPSTLDMEDGESSFDLDISDVNYIEWVIERNEFGLDFAKAFPDEFKRIVVADPNIAFSKLSKDPEVVTLLRNSLKDFLFARDVIPVFIDQYETAWTERYSEEVLAPLFHHRLPPVSTGFHHLDWTGYKELNRMFLNTLVQNFIPGDWILVFNYHLMLLPRMLRERCITRDAHIGFYLGTVFPSSEMYRILPQREELLRGVLAATLIGFHEFQYKRHFLTACTRVLGVECSGDRIEPNVAVGGGAGARVVTVPRGINPYPWLKELQSPITQAKISELREKFKGRKVLLGIDTLDYTKGIPNKMLAFNKFLTDKPEWASKVVFFQICVPKGHGGYHESTGVDQDAWISRVDRREILSNLYQLVGSINANFGNILNQPVHFLLSSLTVENLVCLYGLADIIVITPLRESLSWTAYEFVLCQSYTNKGVIILSEFSGSAQSLGATALCVNPWDPNALASAMYDALVMSDEEKLERHEYAFEYVLNYDSQSWGKNLIEEFQGAVAELEDEKRSIPPRLPCDSLIFDTFQTSQHKIIILGLRGTIFPTTYRGIDPQFTGRMKLPKIIEAALNIVTEDANTSVLIVSSSTVSLMSHAVGQLQYATLMAENGHFERPPLLYHKTAHCSNHNLMTSSAETDHDDVNKDHHWMQTPPDVDLNWMDPVEESCRYFEQRTPGSVVIRTATAVAFNYYNAQREHGANQARDLLIHLWAGPATLTSRTDIVVGPHSVEVRSAASNKASSVERWLKDVIIDKDLDLSKCMILCVANFLPRDEDVFQTLERSIEWFDVELSLTRFATTDDAESQQSIIMGPVPTINSLSLSPPPPPEQMIPQLNINNETGDRLITCTVGLKPSRADYYVSSEKEVESLLILLASLTIMNNPIKFSNILGIDIKSQKMPLECISPKAKRGGIKQFKGLSYSRSNKLALLGETLDWTILRSSAELQRTIVSIAGMYPLASTTGSLERLSQRKKLIPTTQSQWTPTDNESSLSQPIELSQQPSPISKHMMNRPKHSSILMGRTNCRVSAPHSTQRTSDGSSAAEALHPNDLNDSITETDEDDEEEEDGLDLDERQSRDSMDL